MHQIDISRMDLNLLVVFEALLEERHVGRTANRLHLSQSATSHALGRLRRLFNDPLFVRHPAGMEPTSRARELATPLAEALAQVRRVVSPPAPFDPATLVRSYTVATHDYATVVLLTKLMSELRREAPGVDLRCVGMWYPDLVAGFHRGTVDLACGAFPGFHMQRIERTPLFDDSFVGVIRADHPALTAGRVELDAFVATPHVLTSPGGEPNSPVDEALSARGLSRRIAMTVPNPLSVPLLVAGSDLIGVMPARLAATMAANHGVVAFDLPITIKAVTCDLLMPGALAGVAEVRWIEDVFRRSVAHATA